MDDRYSKYQNLLFDTPAEHVLRIRINRPDRLNALTPQAHTELTEVFFVINGANLDLDAEQFLYQRPLFGGQGVFLFHGFLIEGAAQHLLHAFVSRLPKLEWLHRLFQGLLPILE